MSKLRQAAVLILFAFSCFAQRNTGKITGTVTDTSGASVPRVQVVVQNTATNVKYETQTTDAGDYTVPNLQPGPYQITFQAPAFKKLIRSGFSVQVSQVVRVDVALEVGAVTESIQVSAPLPRVQTD